MRKQNEKATPTTAVATTPKNTAVGQVIDYGDDAGKGFENQTRADITIPFLSVLQPLSPEVTNMEDAKPGMLFNTVTEELVDGKTGLVFVPAITNHIFVEWKPRETGGGFIGIHQVDSDVVKAAREASTSFGDYKTPNGNKLQETFYVYGVLSDEDQQPIGPVVIAFTSTKISVYKRWNTKVNMFTVKTPGGAKVRPPLFAHQVRITSVKEKNNKGEFFNFDLQPAVNGSVAESLLPPGAPLLEAAKELREMVAAGLAKPSHDTVTSEAPSSDDPAENWQR